ncbi:MAG TPA: glycosyltransferase family 39 protein [Pirellulales bacterium]|nr:glycosyltransferase family 39 protein [Pirellulales bacterium]
MRDFGRFLTLARHPVAVVVIACLIRGGVMGLRMEQLARDPDGYRALAENLLATGVFGNGLVPTAYRPPLYPLLLAGCLKLAANSTVAIAVLHFVLGVATVVLTMVLARQWRLDSFGPLAGILVACDPILLNQSTLVMTETLAAFLSVAALSLVTAAAGLRSGRIAALAGGVVGLAALCRPTFLLWLVALIVGLAWSADVWRLRFRLGGATLLGAAITLLPWAARNQAQFGRPIVATTHGGHTLLLGNNPDYYQHLASGPWGAVWHADHLDDELRATRAREELVNDRREYALAWQTIRDQPGMFLYACLTRVGRFWGVLPHEVAARDAGRVPRLGVAAWYLLVLGLALVAIIGREISLVRPPWLWGWLLAASFTAAHLLYWSDLRMRAPLVPFVSLLAACGVRRLIRRPKSP